MNEQSVGDGTDVSLVRYGLFIGSVLAIFLATFVLVAMLAVPLLDDPAPMMSGGGVVAALCGVGLLLADVLLPVPSSLVMIAHGMLFGAAAGALLSLIGGVGAALAGYGLGRWAGPPTLRRVCSAAERARAARLVDRWGVLAVIVTRPVPLLAETVAVMAGAQQLGLPRTALASVVGVLPAAVLYAAAGALGWSESTGLVAFGLVLLVAALMWLVGQPPRTEDTRD
ncbi:TVP38/TMEM64 family protein [Pseudonocardia sp. CA-107938]|uniref:TVP38/TMEM64 family protein n=1 Tax=Pseudonocardia sp. CA-107938 TaxID=3240021 RepID=UPI003D931F56